MYPEEMVKPMQAELTAAGLQDLHSAAAADNAIKAEGTTLVVVNSVCGCAARNGHPGAKLSFAPHWMHECGSVSIGGDLIS